jgi:tetratricopeptide (TPR) repeat protein
MSKSNKNNNNDKIDDNANYENVIHTLIPNEQFDQAIQSLSEILENKVKKKNTSSSVDLEINKLYPNFFLTYAKVANYILDYRLCIEMAQRHCQISKSYVCEAKAYIAQSYKVLADEFDEEQAEERENQLNQALLYAKQSIESEEDGIDDLTPKYIARLLLGELSFEKDDFSTAITWLEQGLQILNQQIQDGIFIPKEIHLLADSHYNLGSAYMYLIDAGINIYENGMKAIPQMQSSYSLFQKLDDLASVEQCQQHLKKLAHVTNQPEAKVLVTSTNGSSTKTNKKRKNMEDSDTIDSPPSTNKKPKKAQSERSKQTTEFVEHDFYCFITLDRSIIVEQESNLVCYCLPGFTSYIDHLTLL